MACQRHPEGRNAGVITLGQYIGLRISQITILQNVFGKVITADRKYKQYMSELSRKSTKLRFNSQNSHDKNANTIDSIR